MDVIAIREFEYWASGTTEPTKARLALGKPEYDGEAWIAPYEIHGISPEPMRKGSWGEDAVQALLLSFEIIGVFLDRPGGRLTLAGSAGAPWNHGLPPRAELYPQAVTDLQAELAGYLAAESPAQGPPIEDARPADDRGVGVIAIREFEYLAPGATEPTKARLVLRRPEYDGQAWAAPYEIHGITLDPIRQAAWGEDAVQALLLSFETIYADLDVFGASLTLAGSEGAPWDHGLPRRAGTMEREHGLRRAQG